MPKLKWCDWGKTGNIDKASLLFELSVMLGPQSDIQVSQIKMRLGVPQKDKVKKVK